MSALPDDKHRQAVYEAAERLHELGFTVLPIRTGTKEPPIGFKWGEYRERRPDASERMAWFLEQGHQLAVMAGRMVTPLDFDTPGAFDAMCEACPQLASFPRVRTGSGLEHVWCRVADARRKQVVKTPDGGRMELRYGTHYTLVPPSLHPNGKQYAWEIPLDGDVPTVTLAELGIASQDPAPTSPNAPVDVNGEPLQGNERDNIVAVLAEFWVEGQRTNLTLALAGWLAASQSVPIADTRAIVEALVDLRSPGDDEKQLLDYAHAIENSYRKAAAGEEVRGWAALSEILNSSAMKQLDLIMRRRQPTLTVGEGRKLEEPKHPFLTSVYDLLQEPEEPDVWLVEGLIRAGTVNLTVGPPKTFKTFFEQELHLAVASGTDAFGMYQTNGLPQPTLYIQDESSRRAWRRRWKQMHQGRRLDPEMTRDTLYTVTNQRIDFQDQQSMDRLVKEAIEAVEPVLITFDPLREFHSADENDAREMRPIIQLLKQIRDTYNVAVNIVHHNNKNPNYENPMDSIRGTTALPGAMDGFLFVMRTQDDQQVKVQPLLKEGGQAEPFLYRVTEDDQRGIVLETFTPDDKGTFQPQDIITWARMRGDWWSIETAITELPAGQTTVRAHIRRLANEGKLRTKVGRRNKKHYAHPEVSDDEPDF